MKSLIIRNHSVSKKNRTAMTKYDLKYALRVDFYYGVFT